MYVYTCNYVIIMLCTAHGGFFPLFILSFTRKWRLYVNIQHVSFVTWCHVVICRNNFGTLAELFVLWGNWKMANSLFLYLFQVRMGIDEVDTGIYNSIWQFYKLLQICFLFFYSSPFSNLLFLSFCQLVQLGNIDLFFKFNKGLIT